MAKSTRQLPLLTTVIGWRPRRMWDENGAARVEVLTNPSHGKVRFLETHFTRRLSLAALYNQQRTFHGQRSGGCPAVGMEQPCLHLRVEPSQTSDASGSLDKCDT